ncbi:MAG TPA: FAD-dependent oxidoreductase, partial [bacterium]|nr:FAD-dependent oxidoreductase [bacterium]
LRTREDADFILDAAGKGDPVVVVGGGVLGLETAGALARRGAAVTVLEGHEWLMPRQLNREAGSRLERHISALGIRLEKRAAVRQVSGGPASLVVTLADGRELPAGVVVLAAGVRPNTHLGRRAGLDVNQGVLVNHHMMSSAPAVFAAGDAAEHNGVLYGTWSASQYQGTIAGMNAAELSTVYGGQPRSNTLKVLGLDLLSIGTFDPVDGSYLVVEEKAEDRYLRFVLHDGRLVGAILMGDLTQGPAVKAAIESRLDYSGLLLGSASAAGIAAHAEKSAVGGR